MEDMDSATRQDDDRTLNQIFNDYLPHTMLDNVDTQQEDQQFLDLSVRNATWPHAKESKCGRRRNLCWILRFLTCPRKRLQIGTIKIGNVTIWTHYFIAQGVMKDLCSMEASRTILPAV